MSTETLTFLSVDLERSTRLWEEHPDAMRTALAHHDELVREAVERDGVSVGEEHRRRRARAHPEADRR